MSWPGSFSVKIFSAWPFFWSVKVQARPGRQVLCECDRATYCGYYGVYSRESDGILRLSWHFLCHHITQVEKSSSGSTFYETQTRCIWMKSWQTVGKCCKVCLIWVLLSCFLQSYRSYTNVTLQVSRCHLCESVWCLRHITIVISSMLVLCLSWKNRHS